MKRYVLPIAVLIVAVVALLITFQSEENVRTIHDIQSDEKVEVNNTPIEDQTWFINTQFGLVFETPKKLDSMSVEKPEGTDEFVAQTYNYSLKDEYLLINYLVMETNFTEYDPAEGLRGAINNLISTGGGSRLSLEFSDNENNYIDAIGKGHFYFKELKMNVKGYCLYKDNGLVYILICHGPDFDNVNEKIDRIINSIQILDLNGQNLTNSLFLNDKSMTNYRIDDRFIQSLDFKEIGYASNYDIHYFKYQKSISGKVYDHRVDYLVYGVKNDIIVNYMIFLFPNPNDQGVPKSMADKFKMKTGFELGFSDNTYGATIEDLLVYLRRVNDEAYGGDRIMIRVTKAD